MINIEAIEIVAGEDGFFNYPSGICYDHEQDIFYIADMHNHRICWLDIRNKKRGVLSNTIVGLGSASHLDRPLSVAASKGGNIYTADAGHNCIFVKKRGETDWTSAVNQSLEKISICLNEPALNLPGGVTVDNQGNIYTNDFHNNMIRRIDINGNISTLVGDAIHNRKVSINKPYGIFFRDDKVYFTDTGNNLIRYINLKTEKVSTIGMDKNITSPIAVTVDPQDNIYICEQRCIHYYDNESAELFLILDKKIWKKVSKRFGLRERICHVGCIAVPKKGEIYWIDTIKGLVYRVVIKF